MVIHNLEYISQLDQYKWINTRFTYGRQEGLWGSVKNAEKKLLEFSGSLDVNSTGSLYAQLAFRNCVTPRNMNPIGIFFLSSRSRETKEEKERRRVK